MSVALNIVVPYELLNSHQKTTYRQHVIETPNIVERKRHLAGIMADNNLPEMVVSSPSVTERKRGAEEKGESLPPIKIFRKSGKDFQKMLELAKSVRVDIDTSLTEDEHEDDPIDEDEPGYLGYSTSSPNTSIHVVFTPPPEEKGEPEKITEDLARRVHVITRKVYS